RVLSRELGLRSKWSKVVHTLDLRLQEFLGAGEAWLHGRVEDRALDRDAEAGRRQECVLLGMNADAEVVGRPRGILLRVGAPITPAVHAVGRSAGRTVVAGRDDSLILHQDGADRALLAVGALRHGLRDRHEVGVEPNPGAHAFTSASSSRRWVPSAEGGLDPPTYTCRSVTLRT